MAEGIRSIQTDYPGPIPTPEDEDAAVRFMDIDGTILHEFTYEQLENLTALPPLPTHDGFVATGWNATLEEVKSVSGVNHLDVGALVAPVRNGVADTESTYLTLHPEKNVAFNITFTQTVDKGVTINWGDGNEETVAGTGQRTATHTYTSFIPEVEIVLTPAENCDLGLGFASGSKSMFGGTSEATNPSVSRAIIGRATLNQCAFYYVSMLQEVYLGEKLVNIEKHVFYDACALRGCIIPHTVPELKTYAFSSCKSLQFISIPLSVTTLGTYCFDGLNGLQILTIPISVQEIGRYAIKNLYSVKKVFLPEHVASFGTDQFSSCYNLESLYIPDGVTSTSTFCADCVNLKHVRLPNTLIAFGGFNNCRSLKSFGEIPETVQTISLTELHSLEPFEFPSSLTGFGSSATFVNMYKWTEFHLPASVTAWYYMFNSEFGPTKIIFEDRAAFTGTGTFMSSGGKKVRTWDFTDFTQVPTITSATSFFANLQPSAAIVVPDDLYDDWIVATNWVTKASQIVKESVYYGGEE